MRDLVFAHWQSAGCEAFEDTLKMTSLVDFYVPYFPLERPHVAELARRQLAARGAELRARKGLDLEWDEAVVKFLVGKVSWAGFELEAVAWRPGALLDGLRRVAWEHGSARSR